MTEEERQLLEAAFVGDLDATQRLLDRGAGLGARDSQSNTPLILAALAGHLEVMLLLIVE